MLLLNCYDNDCIETASYAITALHDKDELNDASVKQALLPPKKNAASPALFRRYNKEDLPDEILFYAVKEQIAILKKYDLTEKDFFVRLHELKDNAAVKNLIFLLDGLNLMNKPRLIAILSNSLHADSLWVTMEFLIKNLVFTKDMFDLLTKDPKQAATAHLATVDLSSIGLLTDITAKTITEKPQSADLYCKACEILYEKDLWHDPIVDIISKHPELSGTLAAAFIELSNAKALDNNVIGKISATVYDAQKIAEAHIKNIKSKNTMPYKNKSPYTTLKQTAAEPQFAVDIVDSVMEDLGQCPRMFCK